MTELVKLEKNPAVKEATMLHAVSTLKEEEREVFDYYCQNKDRIKMNQQTIRTIVERDLKAEANAKVGEEVDKKIDEEVSRMMTAELEKVTAQEKELERIKSEEKEVAEAKVKSDVVKYDERKEEKEEKEVLPPYKATKK